MAKIASITNLQKSFGKFQALKDVTFDIYPGEVIGFIGPNGAGKSTTIRILLGTLKRDGGEATIFDKDVWDDRYDIHKRISYVPEDIALWGSLTGGEIIDLFLKLHGSADYERRDYLIDRFDLDPKKKVKTYSKGNRQKVGLISAMAVDSDLYIFDEPTSGLDPLMEKIFQEEVKNLKDQGKAVLLSSHILSEVEKLADRVVIIRQGEIVESGTLEELRHLSRYTVTAQTRGDVSVLKDITGVHDYTQRGDEAIFSVDQDKLNNILKIISTQGATKLEIAPPTLEDLFIRHYEG